MSVEKNLLDVKTPRPTMGLIQDALLGASELTSRSTFLDVHQAQQLLSFCEGWTGWGDLPQPAILKPMRLYTGKQVAGCVFPSIDYHRPCNLHGDDDRAMSATDSDCLVVQGELLTGYLCKRSVGASSGSLLHTVILDRGPDRAITLLNDLQRLATGFLDDRGFTIGSRDMKPAKGSADAVRKTVDVHERFLCHKDTLSAPPEQFEAKVSEMVNKICRTLYNGVIAALPRDNAFLRMQRAGSKGSTANTYSMLVCLGPQNIDGRRIGMAPDGRCAESRSFSHLPKGDRGLRARGFVGECYGDGLEAKSCLFHATAAREGCIDTAVKTSETGYMQRRLVKGTEDHAVQHDLTVRNSNGTVVQFHYGEDSLDPSRSEFVACPVRVSDELFREQYLWGQAETTRHPALQQESDVLMGQRAWAKEFLWSPFAGQPRPTAASPLREKLMVPMSIERMISEHRNGLDARARPLAPDHAWTPVAPHVAASEIVALHTRLRSMLPPTCREALGGFWYLFWTSLASKRVSSELRFTEEETRELCARIEHRFARCLITPGDMVGSMASQSIGQPATQMTLDTNHFIGMTDMNMTLGVPRLKELLGATKKTKTPLILAELLPAIKHDSAAAERVRRSLECVHLAGLVTAYEIHHDPVSDSDPLHTIVRQDVDWVRQFRLASAACSDDLDDKPAARGAYVLRMAIDAGALVARDVTLGCIAEKLSAKLGGGFGLEWTNEYMRPCVVRIRHVYGLEGDHDTLAGSREVAAFKKMIADDLPSLHVAGVEGVLRAAVSARPALDPALHDKEFFITLRRDKTKRSLLEVMAHPGVDPSRSWSNDTSECCEVGGIEFASSVLNSELRKVTGAYGIDIAASHYGIVCSAMTFAGQVLAFSRHGVNRMDTKTLLRASFEKTCEVFHEAARYSQHDPIRSVTENIILGKIAPIGTGTVDLFVPSPLDRDDRATFDRLFPVRRAPDRSGIMLDVVPEAHGGVAPFCPPSPLRSDDENRALAVFTDHWRYSHIRAMVPSSPRRDTCTGRAGST